MVHYKQVQVAWVANLSVSIQVLQDRTRTTTLWSIQWLILLNSNILTWCSNHRNIFWLESALILLLAWSTHLNSNRCFEHPLRINHTNYRCANTITRVLILISNNIITLDNSIHRGARYLLCLLILCSKHNLTIKTCFTVVREQTKFLIRILTLKNSELLGLRTFQRNYILESHPLLSRTLYTKLWQL